MRSSGEKEDGKIWNRHVQFTMLLTNARSPLLLCCRVRLDGYGARCGARFAHLSHMKSKNNHSDNRNKSSFVINSVLEKLTDAQMFRGYQVFFSFLRDAK